MLKTYPNASLWRVAATPLLAVVALLLNTGCEENRQISSEVIGLKEQIAALQREESQAQDEIQKLASGYNAVRENTLIRKAVGTMEQKHNSVLTEVTALKERKEQLQKEVESLNKVIDSYRQKYL